MRRVCRPFAVVLALAGSVTLIGPGGPAGASTGPPRPPYIPPIEAPVVDPFRPPPTPYAAGNRGLDYATTPGTPVVAAADGVVTFAGAVAGALHVTIAHADGIRTSYSYLASITVGAGQVVRQGDVLGFTGATFHVGARRGDVYLDPASLWGHVGPPHVELVPLDGGLGAPSPGRRARRFDRRPA